MTTTDSPQPALTAPWVPEPETVGERILFARTKLRLSQTEFAQPLGYAPSTMATWERGVQTARIIEVCQRISAVYGVDLAWLLTGQQAAQNWKVNTAGTSSSIRHLHVVPGLPGQLTLPLRFSQLAAVPVEKGLVLNQDAGGSVGVRACDA